MQLVYVGQGRYIPDVPARDIDVPDDEAQRLIESGLYQPAKAKAQPKPKREPDAPAEPIPSPEPAADPADTVQGDE
jgi:hypothetical protein